MPEPALPERDLAAFVLPEIGRLVETGDPWEPYRLLGPEGERIEATAVYFADLQARGLPMTTIRSYALDLLRWWRFLWALDVQWDRATRVEARVFARWMQIADKPVRVHWRLKQRGITTPQPSVGDEARTRYAESHHRQAVTGNEVCAHHPGACGDGAAGLLRLPPG